MGMVLPMYDDSMDNILCKYLEDICKRQAAEIRELEVDLDDALRNLEGAERYIDRMHKLFEKQAEEHIMTDLAINIQAAEAEWRYDEKSRECLMRKIAGSYAVPIR